MATLQELREKLARNPAQMSFAERTELSILEQEEKKEMEDYTSKYFEAKRKIDSYKQDVEDLEEKIRMQEAVIKTLLAALQGKIKD